MTTDPDRPETEVEMAESAMNHPTVKTAEGRYIGETEKNLSAPALISKPLWRRLFDRILMR